MDGTNAVPVQDSAFRALGVRPDAGRLPLFTIKRMLRASHHDETVPGPGLKQVIGMAVAMGVAGLAGAWWLSNAQQEGAGGSLWAWIGFGVLMLAASAWLGWAVNLYRRGWVLGRMQTHRLIDVLDVCYWQTDAQDRLVLWRPPHEAPEWQWEVAGLLGQRLWDAWVPQAPLSEAACAARMRNGATLVDVGVRRSPEDTHTWLLRGVPRYDLFGRFNGSEGIVRAQPGAATAPALPPAASAPVPAESVAQLLRRCELALEAVPGPALLLELPGPHRSAIVRALNQAAGDLLGACAGPTDPRELWRDRAGWPSEMLDAAWTDALDEMRLRLRAKDVQADMVLEVERHVAAWSLRLLALPAGAVDPSQFAPGTEWLVLNLEAGSQAAHDAAMEDHEAFMYAVSHDLRAPLRVVEGFSRILKEDYGRVLERLGNDHLDRVLGAAGRMNGMIDALLELAKLSTRPVAREQVNLGQMAGLVIEDLRRSSPQRPADVVVEDGLVAEGDPLLLRMVLENLLGNAWKYSAKRPRTRIEFSRQPQAGRPGLWAYCVRDNGVGFDMRYADRLFGMFQRLHSANDYQGSGVGLASVRRIVHRHGGRIWAESEVDVGTRIFFTLGESAPSPGLIE